VLAGAATELAARVRPGDVVVFLHGGVVRAGRVIFR
jgi:hypothetical protein